MMSESQISNETEEVMQMTDSQKDIEEFFDDTDDMFIFQVKEKKKNQLEFILSSLKNHFIFYNLSPTQLQNVARNMLFSIIPPQSQILIEGRKSKYFFIIERGTMQVLGDDELKKQLKVGDSFGEIALLYKSKRNFIIKTSEECTVWGIDRENFRKAVEDIILKDFEENKSIVDSVPFLNSLTLKQKEIIAGSFVIQKYEKGQSIFQEGQPGSLFYVIKEGSVSVQKNGRVLKTMRKYESFGEKALFYNTLRQVTVIAEEKTICMILGRDTLCQQLGDEIFQVTFYNFIKLAIMKTKYLSKLENYKIQKIMNIMKISTYKDGATIMARDIDDSFRSMKAGGKEKLIVVIEGALRNLSINRVVAYESDVYGEDFLLSSYDGQGIQQEIIVENNSVLAEIKTENIKQIIGGFIDTVIHDEFLTKREQIVDKMKKREKNVKSLNQMVYVKQLEPNFFGRSFLAGWQDSDKKKYLLNAKFYRKSKVQDQGLFNYFLQESIWFKSLCHPFIIELYKTFQDAAYLISVYQFVQGQELYSAIRSIGLLSSQDARFYISSMILVIQYLCSQGIMIRDLSPTVFLVDDDGYLKLQSLACSKLCKNNDVKLKTKTVIGTPHYTAPEVILSQGYNFTASLFSLGINLFEFLCGYVPFGENSDDPLEIYESIINDRIKYPSNLIDEKARDLMEQLLNKHQPDSRLGGPTFSCLKENPWFVRFDWQKLQAKELNAPMFNRKVIITETVEELLEDYDKYHNLQAYVNQILPLRNVGNAQPEGKYWNW